jgi:hypothetical protein
VTEHERIILEAAARLEQESLSETIRKNAVQGAIDQLRAVPLLTKREQPEVVEEQQPVA